MRKIISNSLFYGGERVLYLILGMIANGLIARSISLNEFGILNTAYSIVGIFGFLFSMGLEYNLVKFITGSNNNKSLYLFSGVILRIIGSCIGVCAISFISYIFYGSQMLTIAFLIAIAGIFNSLSLFDCILQAKEDGFSSFKSKLISRLICFGFQLSFFLYSPSLVNFATSNVIMNISLILLQYLYIRKEIKFYNSGRERLKIKKYINVLFKESWPLAISGIAVTIFLQSDIIIISMLMDSESVALYSAVTKILIPSSFIPYAITQAFYPAFLRVKSNKVELVNMFNKLNMMLITIAYIGVFISFFFAKDILLIAYGEKYLKSIDLFQWLSITIILTFLGAASSKLLIVDGLQKHELYKSLCAAIINIILNFLLIPLYGINGSALASIMALMIANLIYFLLIPNTRFIFESQIKSLIFLPLIKVIMK